MLNWQGGPLAKVGMSAKYEQTSKFTLVSQRSFLRKINKAYKTQLQNKKDEYIKGKLSYPETKNTRAFYKTAKMLVDKEEKKQTAKNRN